MSLSLSLPAAAWFLRGETGNPVFDFLDSPIRHLQPIATQLGKYRRGMTKIKDSFTPSLT